MPTPQHTHADALDVARLASHNGLSIVSGQLDLKWITGTTLSRFDVYIFYCYANTTRY